ncbi:tRNA (adenine(22)-N(1))-methyltransferase TrmK [Virgibacillus sp. SK37]|uniref:tRNA (adenine(22)-N(1))-methyltransferase n=1 Tax=Virgibacillus sp. SK37 TaxID=403957 RepID=UPI0004D18D2A|nr:tRNA (adenine(22)-N(1))-methyltransferase TrmK [Virgibacillus sp. SK37]AIF43407.1 tRNA methyltransferase [Virgibacillus sp. SK37]
MTNNIKLSKRLKQTASYLPMGANFADIGSDHAYLPCYVCLKDKQAKAIAGEINDGPFQSATQTVREHGLEEVVDVRLGDGLDVLTADEVTQVVIAGMGGALIRSILQKGINKLESVERIIAQPNVDARDVREWFKNNNFIITEETIIEENGHIYEIVVGDRHSGVVYPELSQKQLLFGPLLLENKPEAFYTKWAEEYEKLNRVISQMRLAKHLNSEKLNRFETELRWMEEVLQYDGKSKQ